MELSMFYTPVPSLLRELIEDRHDCLVDCRHIGNLTYTDHKDYGVSFIDKYKVYGYQSVRTYFPIGWDIVVPLTQTEQRLSDALDALYELEENYKGTAIAFVASGGIKR